MAGEISEAYHDRQADGEPTDDLLSLVKQIVPYHMAHNAEPEAVDLLVEVERLDLLTQYVDEGNCRRTCLYLTNCHLYLPEPENTIVLRTSHEVYMKMGMFHDALRVALKINEKDVIEETFATCDNPLEKKQLGYLLARHGVVVNLEDGPAAIEDESLQDAVQYIISNSNLSELFLELARDLDVMEAKV